MMPPKQILFNGLKASCNENVFSLLTQHHDIALYVLLRDHDDNFNRHFLTFIELAWAVKDRS